ncbi:anthrone oxygenase family protein [Modestobacter altitudinis]|uniref:anthrone oxygenase family protein n=1 Tax=Modestobacter altitudinis TaxID=2213158 RepID=UPI001C55669B|nr:anthrone oxygenase family protein [Modestobacter altitudinis]
MSVRGVVLLATGLSAAVVAGAFAVFSLMVMPALAALPGAGGIAAMQSVNRTAVRPVFTGLLFGTALLCLVVGGWELGGDRRPAVLVGVGLYLVGVVGVTVLANVPLNDALARADGTAVGQWTDYLRRWTAWNTVRALASLAAGSLLVVVLVGAE